MWSHKRAFSWVILTLCEQNHNISWSWTNILSIATSRTHFEITWRRLEYDWRQNDIEIRQEYCWFVEFVGDNAAFSKYSRPFR